jgi:hypothetical protein
VARRRTPARALAAACLLAIAGCGDAPRTAGGPAGTYEFTGSWNASGTRRVLALGAGRHASLVDLQGAMLLAGPGRPGVGFRAEVIALVDSGTGLVGRGVWTDESGDRVFSELTGEGTAAKNRITGSILGGTGRYAGATGAYEFSWQYVIEAEDDRIQGRAMDLKGRVILPGGPR